MIPALRPRCGWLVLGSLLAATLLASADSVEQFGLRHSTLGEATFENASYALEVIGLGTNGTDGLSSEFGAPDSGVFIYPDTREVDWGYSMTARVYGSLNGQTNTYIGTVYGYRVDYAQFYAGVDYSPIGATNLTFQLWRGPVLIAESTVTNGEVFMYGEYATPPRVNPWWRHGNEGYGTLIEFNYPLPVALPGGCDLYGDKIFIRANGATGVVDYISRTDVFGGGGLENFSYRQVRLGMFGHPHLAVGSVKFAARPGLLKLDEIGPGEEDGGGVLVELPPSERATVNLLPLELAIPNTNGTRHRLELSAAGSYNNAAVYIGSLFLSNTNGVLELTPYIYDEEISTMEVYSNNVLVSSNAIFNTNPPVRIEGAPRVTSFEATADTLASPASLGVSFDTNATITLTNGTQVVGNRIVVRTGQRLRFADISTMVLNAYEVPSFTIIGESSEPLVPPQLEIFRSGTNVVLRWLDPAQAYQVEFKTQLDGYFSSGEFAPLYTNGTATVQLTPLYDTAFFRLQRYFSRNE